MLKPNRALFATTMLMRRFEHTGDNASIDESSHASLSSSKVILQEAILGLPGTMFKRSPAESATPLARTFLGRNINNPEDGA